MAELHIDMTIPIGDAGIVRFTTSINDLDQLTPTQRQVIADTGHEFYAFAAATIAPPDDDEVYEGTPATDEPSIDELRDELDATPPPATVHNTDGDILRGVTGSRIRNNL